MRFSRDRRGQSVVIGTVILFGFLILALSLYQVQVVPQQNGQVEFQHFEEVRNDLVELRAGIVRAGSTDRAQYETIRLGTQYPTRIFAINPPDPSGTIRTSDSYNISVTNGTESVNVTTRFIKYQPGYNRIQPSPTWYDASVLYIDERGNGGGFAVIEDQSLVGTDGTVRITALQNEFQQSGLGRVTIELYPTENDTKSLPTGDLTIGVPTRLTGEEYWDDTEIPAASYGGVVNDSYDDGVHKLTIETKRKDLELNTVGIQKAPEGTNPVSTVSATAPSEPEGPPTSDEPSLGEFTVSVSKSTGNDKIQEATADGTTVNPDPNYEIRLELRQGGDSKQNEIQMTDPFSVSTDSPSGNPKQLDVTVDLLDGNGNVVQSCESNEQLSTSNSLNTEQGDFTCS
ncbi:MULTISPECIES: hypothetical protein [unclassified Halorubrum]|uniref:hypothetical protein n=1 Tax=unclassified Halorubrum TaxID=2642239 RepID=UPI000B98B088|nr:MULTISPECIES: hypothetical protein [unclassified Halorubrum]OYR41360.1 hypothetical protein DJ75_14150 [Halorubrum sp. Eb13]OYR46028.1 hypothetical protein DJ81_03780 [Halorubrum sp. Hd13]